MASVGPWGYHLPLGLKWSITLAAGSAVYWEWTDDDVGWDDIGVGFSFGVTMYGLWTPPVVKAALMANVGLAVGRLAAPAAPVIAVTAVALVAGDLISHALDPEEGRKNFRDFVTTPSKIPSRIAFTAETIYEHKIEKPLVRLANWYISGVDEVISQWERTWRITSPW